MDRNRAFNNNEENTRTLVALGLTRVQTKIYLALISLGPATVKEIAHASSVARPDAYRGVSGLQELGIVEKIVALPTKVKPLPIENAVSILMLRRTKENLDLNKNAEKMIDRFKEKTSRQGTPEDHQFVLINRNTVEFELQRLLDKSKATLSIMVSAKEVLRWLDNFHAKIQTALERGVTIRIITEESNGSDAKKITALKRFPNFEWRRVDSPPAFSLRIYDGKEIFLAASKLEQENYGAVFSNNSSLVALAQNYFDSAWFSAIEPQDQKFKHDSRQFDYLFSNLNNGFSYVRLFFGAGGKIVDFALLGANDGFEKITGIRKSVLGEKVTKVLPSEVVKNFLDVINKHWQIISSGKSATFEYHAKTLEKWFSITAYSPEEGFLATIMEDITERKKVEESLRESEEKYRYLAKYAPAPIYEIDCKTLKITNLNECMSTLSGYSEQELLSMSPFDLLDAESQKLFQEIIRKTFAGEKIDENVLFGIKTKQGTKLWATLTAKLTYKNNEPDRAFVVAHDVTEKKKTRDLLEESEEKFRNLAEESPNMIFINKSGRIVYANRNCEETLGYTREELCSPEFNFLNLVSPEYRAIQASNFRTHMRGGEVSPLELPHITKDGKRIDVLLTTKVIKYGEETAVLGTAVDITERLKKESELRQERDKLEAVTRTTGVGLSMIGPDFQVLWINQVLKDRVGNVESQKCHAVFHGRDSICPDCGVKKIFQDGASFDKRETCVEYGNFGVEWVEVTAVPLKNDKGQVVAALETGVSITERKKAELKLKEKNGAA